MLLDHDHDDDHLTKLMFFHDEVHRIFITSCDEEEAASIFIVPQMLSHAITSFTPISQQA